MDAFSLVDPEILHVQDTQVTTSSMPVGWNLTETATMFSHSLNPRFKNCIFNANSNTDGVVSGLNILYQNVAPNAILNAGGRADEVGCHPGTREDVIALINKWRRDSRDYTTASRMFWLSGPAGAGKTAIVQTVAEKWKALDIAAPNFFFFRMDPSRRHASSLVSTLLYQIFDFYPSIRAIVEKTLTSKPRLLEASIAEQFDRLICAPFRSIEPPFLQPIVLLIDGLDECDWVEKTSQRHILQALDKLVGQKDLPFSVLIASRQEPHISMAFKGFTSPVSSIFLDNQYSPAKDIRTFVEAEFEKIKTLHTHAGLLDSDWPPDSDITEIVQKSSGQFVYAATVMRYLAYSSAVPSLSLQIIQGIVPPATNSPFAYLDSFYLHILKQAGDHEVIRDILSAKLLDDRVTSIRGWTPPMRACKRSLPPILEFLELYNPRYTVTQIVSSISSVASLIQLQENKQVVCYHASLADFLLDSSRSNIFHVDLDAFTAKVFPRIWKQGTEVIKAERGLDARLYEDYGEPLGLILLHLVQQISPAITDTLLSVHPSNFHSFSGDMCSWIIPFVRDIRRLYENRDEESYQQILKDWITWVVLVHGTSLRIYEHYWMHPSVTDGLPSPTIRRCFLVAKMCQSLSNRPVLQSSYTGRENRRN